MNEEEGLTDDPDRAGALTSGSQPPELCEVTACGLNRSVSGRALQQPEPTKAVRQRAVALTHKCPCRRHCLHRSYCPWTQDKRPEQKDRNHKGPQDTSESSQDELLPSL